MISAFHPRPRPLPLAISEKSTPNTPTKQLEWELTEGVRYAPVRNRLSKDALDYFREQGAKGGKMGGASGGKKAAAGMTKAQRKARATKASQAAAVARTKKKQAKG